MNLLNFFTKNEPAVESITSDNLQVAINAKQDLLIIDVREIGEFASGHIPQAINIPLGELSSKSNELSTTKTIIVMCRSGGRSLRGCEILKTKGFTSVKNLSGGIMGWNGKIKK